MTCGIYPTIIERVVCDVLAKFGFSLREPYTKLIAGDIFELRTIQGTNAVRTLFFFYYNDTIVLTNGFIKKTKKTPRAEIKKAEYYRLDWIERHANGL